eukprot:TRINITY_DN796_c0_g1_i1.p1 TRINITY_DN796_c0_g1~~TRINITY_DN796_c0_g1_i1.p1  ORF type:complete len:156 (-),score=50.68 TRINITY_DN796_c0_g1_i1:521-988(-)
MADEFEQAGSGASKTYPAQASSIKKNAYCVMKGRPCKVVETSTSKTGKHGHAKVHMVGIDIFSGKKYEEICPSTHNMDVPLVNRTEYQLLDIADDGFVSLLQPDGSTKDNLKMPEDIELAATIRSLFEAGKDVAIAVVSSMDDELIMGAKEAVGK